MEQKPQVVFPDKWSYSENEAANQALKHVLTTSGPDQSLAMDTYRKAVEEVEGQARDIYKKNPVNPLPDGEEFINSMIRNGCFILQLVFCYMGGSDLLGYTSIGHYFSREPEDQKVRWVESIFCIRKQLPLIVLKQLMNQSFFKKVFNLGKWKRPDYDLPGMAMYDFLIIPPLNNQHQPPTLLHALWLLLIGPSVPRLRSFLGDRWLQLMCPWRGCYLDDNNRVLTISSATNLHKSGVIFKNNGGNGIRGIKFQKGWFHGYLFLPSIAVEPETTQVLIKNLIDYERGTEFPENEHILCEFLHFLCEVIRSSEDSQILVKQGIIYTYLEQEKALPDLLNQSIKCHCQKERRNESLSVVRYQVHHYAPIKRKKILLWIAAITVFLTLLQTIYTITTFHRK